MRKLSILFLAVIISAGASAQTLIPKAGLNFSTFSVSDDISGELGEDFKFKAGLTVGAGYEILISDAFAIQPELLFQQKGGMLKDGDDKVTFNINYLELPVMVKYKFSNFYVNAGPYAAFGLGGKVKSKFDGTEVKVDLKFGDDDGNGDAVYLDNAFDFGVQIGGGVVVMEKIIIDLRYGHGFGNLIDEEDGFDNKWQNRSIQLTVGYPISFK